MRMQNSFEPSGESEKTAREFRPGIAVEFGHDWTDAAVDRRWKHLIHQ